MRTFLQVAAFDIGGGEQTFSAVANWWCANGKSRHPISKGLSVLSALRNAAGRSQPKAAPQRSQIGSEIADLHRAGGELINSDPVGSHPGILASVCVSPT